jgi:hypothetical protein
MFFQILYFRYYKEAKLRKHFKAIISLVETILEINYSKQ